MMNPTGDHSDADHLDSELDELWERNLGAVLRNSGVGATTIYPDQPIQTSMSSVNADKNSGVTSSNASQHGTAPLTVSSLSPSSARCPTQNQGIISSAVKYLSDIAAQSSQSNNALQRAFKGKAIIDQQPTTYSLPNHSKMTVGDQMNQLHPYQLPSYNLVPSTGLPVNAQNSVQEISSHGIAVSAPAGFVKPCQFVSSAIYRDYALSQIKKMKERYYNELLKMHTNATVLAAQAPTLEIRHEYEKVKLYIEKMMVFLNTSRAEGLPKDDEMIYKLINTVVNFMSYHMNKPDHSPFQLLKTPLVQPSRVVNLQNNPSQRVVNAAAASFNQNFPSRRPPLPQFANPLLRMGSQFPLISKTTGANFPSPQLNHRPPIVNHNLYLEKMKAPLHKPVELTEPKFPPGWSPVPNHVNPITQQTSSVSSSNFDVNNVLRPPSTQFSGTSSLSTANSQKTNPPMDPPSQEPKTIMDPILHLSKVVQSIPSRALHSSLRDISSIEKETDMVPYFLPPNLVETNDTLEEYDRMPLPKLKREFTTVSMFRDQFDSRGCETNEEETSGNKRTKIENKWIIMEEIREINSKLVETLVMLVRDPSEDNISVPRGHEETIIKCSFTNVCFPDLRGPQGGVLSEEMPNFVILLLLPADYPNSSPRIFESTLNLLMNEPWRKLYEEMLKRLNNSLDEVSGKVCLREIARRWETSAHAVMADFMQKRGGRSFSSMYGSWENCNNTSSSHS